MVRVPVSYKNLHGLKVIRDHHDVLRTVLEVISSVPGLALLESSREKLLGLQDQVVHHRASTGCSDVASNALAMTSGKHLSHRSKRHTSVRVATMLWCEAAQRS